MQGERLFSELFLGLGKKVEKFLSLCGSFSLKPISGGFPQQTLFAASGQTPHPPLCWKP